MSVDSPSISRNHHSRSQKNLEQETVVAESYSALALRLHCMYMNLSGQGRHCKCIDQQEIFHEESIVDVKFKTVHLERLNQNVKSYTLDSLTKVWCLVKHETICFYPHFPLTRNNAYIIGIFFFKKLFLIILRVYYHRNCQVYL